MATGKLGQHSGNKQAKGWLALYRKMLACLVIVLLVMVAGVGAQKVKITHLTYNNHGQAFHEYLEMRAEAFNKKDPNVQVEINIGDHDKFTVMVAGGVAPDVVDLPDFADRGVKGGLINLRPLMERDNIARLVGQAMVDAVTMPNGQIYSLPFEVGSTPAFFNRDLFEKAGLAAPDKLGNDWTWQAAFDAAKKLTKLTADEKFEYIGLDRPWGYWRRAVFQAGGDFIEVDKDLTPIKSLFNTPEVLRGVEYVERFYREKLTAHLAMSWDEHTAFYFWKGKSALDFCDGMGIVAYGYLLDADFNWDFALQPRGPGGPIGEIGVSGPHIVADSKNVDAAWEWMKFYAYDRDALEKFISLTGRLPALKAVQPSYATVKGIRDKNFNAIFEQTMYPNPQQYPVPRELSSRFVSLDSVWKGDQPAETFLQSVHDKMTAYIQEMYAK
jgi:multiple sugar transport system substrate-binding protein